MKVRPSEQGVKPLPVVKEQTLWVQVPPVSLGHPHGLDLINLKNQQQPSENPNTLTMRHVSQIINNNFIKSPQHNNHEVLELIAQRDTSPTVFTSYNISEGENKFLLGCDKPDTLNVATTNLTHGIKETYAETLFGYDQLITSRQTSKPYSRKHTHKINREDTIEPYNTTGIKYPSPSTIENTIRGHGRLTCDHDRSDAYRTTLNNDWTRAFLGGKREHTRYPQLKTPALTQ
jgi:hypothetical protein